MQSPHLIVLAHVVLALLVPLKIESQSASKMLSQQGTFSMFREPSYVSATGGFGNIDKLIFEADIIPYFLVKLSGSDRWGIELSPEIILRMYNEKSVPVRSPSFMPRITGFYQIRQPEVYKSDLFGYLSVWHHSNGQENDFYNDDKVTINTRTGNFSTNAAEVGLFMSEPDKLNPNATRYIKLSTVYHFMHVTDLNNIYGDLRFFVDLQSIVNVTKTLRMLNLVSNNSRTSSAMLYGSVKFGYIADNFNHTKAISLNRLIFKGTISYKPFFLHDINLFAQYYYGQDYYNISFSRQLHLFRFGLMARPNFIN